MTRLPQPTVHVVEIRAAPGGLPSGRATTLQPAVSLFALGMMGLGVLALVYGDFALVWQPVASWVPGRTALAYASGGLMLAGGVGLLFRATAAWSMRVLFPYLIAWTLLKMPGLIMKPQIEDSWLGFGELAVLLAGGWVLFARLADLREGSRLQFATGENGMRIAKYVFAIWVIPIGLSHFFYVQATINLIPAWIPFRTFWAYLTGAGHIAAGLGVLFSVVPRFAAAAEAAMLSIITLVVWATAIHAAPRIRLPWTAFWISWAITAAVWVLALNISAKKVSDGPSNIIPGIPARMRRRPTQ